MDPDSALTETAAKRDAYSVLRVRDYRLFLIGHVVSVLGVQMQTVAVGWQLYEQTRSAWALGMVGLAQFAPMLGLSLVDGQVADHPLTLRRKGYCLLKRDCWRGWSGLYIW